MSIKDAEAFRDKVLADPELQNEIRDGYPRSQEAFLTKLGSRLGYEFSQEESTQVLQAHARDELSDFELEMVQAAQVSSGYGHEDKGGSTSYRD